MSETVSGKIRVEITTGTIIKIVVILLGLFFFYAIRRVIVMAIFAFILASSLRPLLTYLTKHKIPKGLAVAVIYLLLAVIVLAVISAISVPLVKQSINLFSNFSNILAGLLKFINDAGEKLGAGSQIIDSALVKTNFNNWVGNLTNNLGNFLSTGISGVITFFGGLFTIVTFFVLSIYMTIDYENIPKVVLNRVKDRQVHDNIAQLFKDVEKKLGSWLAGQTLLCLSIGVLTWIFLSILRIPYALPLALFAAILEILPGIGPIISAIPAFIVALTMGNIIQIIGIPISYIIIHQLENNLLAPKIISNAIGLSPLIVILALLIGGELYGPAGVLLAVPVVGVLNLGLEFWLRAKE